MSHQTLTGESGLATCSAICRLAALPVPGGKLGLATVRTDADGSRVYASGGVESLVVYPSPDHAGRSSATLVTWYVDDVEQVVDELTVNGVTFEQYEGVLESGFDYSTDEKGISPWWRRQRRLVQGS